MFDFIQLEKFIEYEKFRKRKKRKERKISKWNDFFCKTRTRRIIFYEVEQGYWAVVICLILGIYLIIFGQDQFWSRMGFLLGGLGFFYSVATLFIGSDKVIIEYVDIQIEYIKALDQEIRQLKKELGI